MSPELVKLMRIMRLVVLVVFIGIMLWQATTVSYIFAAVGVAFFTATVWQLWVTAKDGD